MDFNRTWKIAINEVSILIIVWHLTPISYFSKFFAKSVDDLDALSFFAFFFYLF